jgi:hypothetical protein
MPADPPLFSEPTDIFKGILESSFAKSSQLYHTGYIVGDGRFSVQTPEGRPFSRDEAPGFYRDFVSSYNVVDCLVTIAAAVTYIPKVQPSDRPNKILL